MESDIIELADEDAWTQFFDENRDAIIDQYGSEAAAHKHATDGGLMLGGGAAPTFLIIFAM